MKQIPNMTGTKRKFSKKQNVLDEINTISMNGVNSNNSNDLNDSNQKGGNGDIKLSDLLLNNITEIIEKKCYSNIKEVKDKKNIDFIIKNELFVEIDNKPDDIIIFFSRTSSGGKDNTPVLVDEILNLYDIPYYLSAVVIHQGNLGGGHYWTLAKRGNNKWVKLDDDKPVEYISDEDRKNETNGTTTDGTTNGVLFLYRNEKEIKTKNEGNGIQNIKNSCYFNSILQFLITTHEYQNINKMKVTRPNLHSFLTKTTEVSNKTDIKGNKLTINDGKHLKEFEGNTGATGVAVFGLKTGCQESADQALNKIFDYSEFKYNNKTNILLIDGTSVKNEKFNEQDEQDDQYFTSNPPFYKYIFKQTSVPKNTENCDNKETIKLIIQQFSITLVYKNIKNNEIKNNTNKIKITKKQNLDSFTIKTSKKLNAFDIQKYKNIKTTKGLDRIKLQFDIIYNTIPELDTGNAVVGEDSIKDLVNQESKMRVMAKTMSGYAENLIIDKKNLNLLFTDAANNKIQEKEEQIEYKMNEINILFQRLFHRREKLSEKSTIWVK